MSQDDVPQSNITKSRLTRGGVLGDKRKGEFPVPVNLRDVLSKDQISSLKEMENFGWHLAFVRRAGEKCPIAVVARNDNSGFGVLEQDGSISTDSGFEVRH